MNKSYLTLSVGQIKELLAAAEASRDTQYYPCDPRRDCHCVVLHFRTYPAHNNLLGEEQIAWDSWSESLFSIRARAARQSKLLEPESEIEYAAWETGGSVTEEQNERLTT